MSKAIIIGGTFNPITTAHEEMGRLIKQMYPHDDVYYVPSNLSYIKDWKDLNVLFDDETRLKLVEETASRIDCKVLDKEAKGELSGKTYETVTYLKETCAYEEVIVCCGTDKLNEIARWYQAEKLVNENQFVVFKREEYVPNEFVEMHKDRFKFIDFAYAEISSTRIREAYEKNELENVRNEIPRVVYDYLEMKRH